MYKISLAAILAAALGLCSSYAVAKAVDAVSLNALTDATVTLDRGKGRGGHDDPAGHADIGKIMTLARQGEAEARGRGAEGQGAGHADIGKIMTLARRGEAEARGRGAEGQGAGHADIGKIMTLARRGEAEARGRGAEGQGAGHA